MIQNRDIVVVIGDTNSSIVIMRKTNYVKKLDTMIGDGIMKGTHIETTDNTLKEYRDFRSLYKNFHNYEHYKDMEPNRNQPACLYGIAKTHKFDYLVDITVANLTF